MLKQQKCWTVICDVCGNESENIDGFVMHYSDELKDEAEDDARNADWWVWNGHHRCESCGIPLCSTCAHMFGDHDMGEDVCDEGGCDCKQFTIGEIR